MMRIVVHVGCSFVLTVLLGALWRLTPFEMIVPNLPLLYALYLGASSRNPIWEAAAAAIVIGYLGDVVTGAPRGVGAFALGTVCILTRLVSIRLLFRGWLLVAVLSFVAAAVAGLLTLGLCAYGGAGIGPLPRELGQLDPNTCRDCHRGADPLMKGEPGRDSSSRSAPLPDVQSCLASLTLVKGVRT